MQLNTSPKPYSPTYFQRLTNQRKNIKVTASYTTPLLTTVKESATLQNTWCTACFPQCTEFIFSSPTYTVILDLKREQIQQ